MVDGSRRARIRSAARSVFELDPEETARWASRFGVADDQIRHDFIISHLLATISHQADHLVFFGGTALSRTFLPGCSSAKGRPALTRADG